MICVDVCYSCHITIWSQWTHSVLGHMHINILTPLGTDESSELEMENRQRLNSTLLDDSFAKNIDELKGFIDVSPIINEGEFFGVITARVRSTTGRYCFHRCLSVHRGGYPDPPPGGTRTPPPPGGVPGPPSGGVPGPPPGGEYPVRTT